MIKKVLIASGFLVGGYFLIKRLLPNIKKSNGVKIDLGERKSADEVFEKAKKERETKIEKKREELQKQDFSRFGSYGGYARHSILEAYKRSL